MKIKNLYGYFLLMYEVNAGLEDEYAIKIRMRSRPWYKILGLVLFWDFATTRQGHLEVLLAILILIFLLDSKLSFSSKCIPKSWSWSGWPFYGCLILLALGTTFLNTLDEQQVIHQNRGFPQGPSIPGSKKPIQQSKLNASGNPTYSPVPRPVLPGKPLPFKRTFTEQPKEPAKASDPGPPVEARHEDGSKHSAPVAAPPSLNTSANTPVSTVTDKK